MLLDLDKATRIGIGGVGVTVAFTFLLLIFPHISPIPSYVGLCVGAVLMIWGFWPIVGSVSLGDLSGWNIPLMRAARICYEKSENASIGRWVARTNTTPHKRLSYFIASFITNEVPMYGERPPSTVARRIPVQETKGVISKDEGNDLMNLYDSKEVAYRNVYIRRPDLWRHLRYLKKLNNDEDVKRLFR